MCTTRLSLGRWLLMTVLGAWLSPGAAAELTVSAAASLTQSFSAIGKAFESASQGQHKVLFNFGASGSLLQQIARGAPVDVLATADLETMDRADKLNLIVRDSRSHFASNQLVLAIPALSAFAPKALGDLSHPGVRRIAVGVPESVPVGRYAKAALEAAGLWTVLQHKFVFGQSVRQCLDYIARGEVDAGFVYVTDVALMTSKVRLALGVPTREPIRYPIAVVKGNGQTQLAHEFVRFVRDDPRARGILARFGFKGP